MMDVTGDKATASLVLTLSIVHNNIQIKYLDMKEKK